MNREPFDDRLSLELRSLVEDANPPPTLRPATGVPARYLPRPWIVIGSVAAVIVAMLALLLSGSSGTNRQHVTSEGKTGGGATSTTDNGIIVPVVGDQVTTSTTITHVTTSTTKKPAKLGPLPSTSTTLAPPSPSIPLAVTRYSLNDEWFFGITMGPDGNMWAVSWMNVARITPTGQVTKFPYRSSINGYGQQTSITMGPDGNLWFTEWSGDTVGRITTTGVITQFHANAAFGITSGPDGALWFTEPGSVSVNGQWTPNKAGVGRITTSGQVTDFVTEGQPIGIARGSDGNLWFADSSVSKVGRITPSGAVTEYPTPHAPVGVTLGADGNVWYQSRYGDGYIGRIAPSGDVKEFAAEGQGTSWGSTIVLGPDRNIWAAGDPSSLVSRIDARGRVTTFENPGVYNQYGIAAGPGGTLWITDEKGLAVFKPPAA